MEKFGRYVLLEKIASGGMAEVFRAAVLGSAGFAKPVAVKRILPHLTAEESVVKLLVEEAKIASTLHHRNVVRVMDLGEVQGQYFLAMEYVAGQSLHRMAVAAERAARRIPLPLCFHVVHQALQGLAYVHEKRDVSGRPMELIHRDISPQNIMVNYDGEVLLVDFGVARATHRPNLTQDGILRGKPAYMSPDLLHGGPVTQDVDIYAMGVVLHELIALRPLRVGETSMQVMAEVMRGDVPRFQDLGLEVPESAAEVVYKALSPTREGRWRDAQSFARAMEDVIQQHGWQLRQADVAAYMAQCFPLEIKEEAAAQARFAAVVADLSTEDAWPRAGEAPSAAVVAQEPGTRMSDVSPAALEAVNRRARRTAVATGLGGAAVALVLAAWVLTPTREPKVDVAQAPAASLVPPPPTPAPAAPPVAPVPIVATPEPPPTTEKPAEPKQE
ncbi:MAG: serine/threonine-protein kinase, partial [Myxococcota bacterium]